MSIIKKMRKDDAVYWARTGVDKYGKAQYAAPVAVRCRWDDMAVMFKDNRGEERISSAVVYTDIDVVPGGRLWHGLLGSQPSELTTANDVFEIVQFGKINNLRHTEQLRTAYL